MELNLGKAIEYILLILMSGGNVNGGMQMHGYNSKATCEKDGQIIVKQLKNSSARMKRAKIRFHCVIK